MNFKSFESAIQNKINRTVNQWIFSKWANAPLADTIRASKETYLSLWEETKKKSYPEIDKFEESFGNPIDTYWLDQLALHTQICIKESELCYQHGRVVYSALSKYLDNRADAKEENITILETGSSRGFSSTCMAKALNDKGFIGNIFTFDLLPHNTPIYWNCIDDHDGKKSRRELLSPWKDLIEQRVRFIQGDTRVTLQSVNLDRINFAFLDGGHTYEHVRREFDHVQKYQQSGDVIVFDDYTKDVFDGLIRAVDDGCVAYGYTPEVINAHSGRGYVIATKK